MRTRSMSQLMVVSARASQADRPDGRHAYVAYASDHLAMFHPATKRAFLNNTHSNDVTVVDTESREIVETIAVGEGGSHQGMAFDVTMSRLYVANHGSGTISVINARSLVPSGTIAVGAGPRAVIVTGQALVDG